MLNNAYVRSGHPSESSNELKLSLVVRLMGLTEGWFVNGWMAVIIDGYIIVGKRLESTEWTIHQHLMHSLNLR